jgi:hypothetical protein
MKIKIYWSHKKIIITTIISNILKLTLEIPYVSEGFPQNLYASNKLVC